MKKNLKFCLMLLVGILLASCYSNSLSFDIEDQSIISTSGKRLTEFQLIKVTGVVEQYNFSWSKKDGSAPFRIKVAEISTCYNIEQGWERKEIDGTSFKLIPLSKYKISRAGGDAGRFNIIISTDSVGRVIKALEGGHY